MDIPEHTTAEATLDPGEDRFRQMADAMPQIVWVARPDGYHEYFNRPWYDYTGLSVGHSVGQRWSSTLHPDDRHRSRQRWAHCLASGEPYEIEYRLARHDGAYRWFLGRALPIRDEAGRIVRWIGTCTDIDDKKQGEEELLQSEARFRLLTETIPQVVWMAGPSGTMEYFNKRWYDYTGLSADESCGQLWQQLLHPDERDDVIGAWLQAVGQGRAYETEHRLRRRDGQYRWQLVRALPLRDGLGQVVQWVGTVTDIDDQRRAAEALEQAVAQRTALLEETNTALQRSNRELEEFAYVASHDLQEPLRKIQAFGDRLQLRFAEKLGDQGREYVERMQSSAARMQKLINDLLTLSRVTTRGQSFVPVDLKAVVQDVLGDLEDRLAQSNGRVEVGPLPVVEADPTQMRQLFQNLVGNGLKFRKPDVPPLVRVGSRELDGAWEIQVVDNGIGFEDIYKERIFQVFQRLHGRNEYEGTGVGLAICRKIVERHGGSIDATGKPGEGSTFTVVLPGSTSIMAATGRSPE